LLVASAPATAEPVPIQDVSSKEGIQAALSGGVALGRWKEGLLFEGISLQPWLKSAANWFPNTEEVQRVPGIKPRMAVAYHFFEDFDTMA
jgi:hypothetical protein